MERNGAEPRQDSRPGHQREDPKGQLGTGGEDDRLTPAQIGTATDWLDVVTAAGGHHTCATTRSAGLWCWGDNELGQVGDGTITGHNAPVQIIEEVAWRSVALSASSTCALRTDDSMWCWGSNADGRLGLGNADTDAQVSVPTQAMPL